MGAVDGHTALYWAVVFKGNAEAVELLLQHNANGGIKGRDGRVVALDCVRPGEANIRAMLVAAGDDGWGLGTV